MRKISVTLLAQHLKYDRQELKDRIVELGLIFQSGKNWKLTELGKSKGGEEIRTDNYNYI